MRVVSYEGVQMSALKPFRLDEETLCAHLAIILRSFDLCGFAFSFIQAMSTVRCADVRAHLLVRASS
jgi:hypothetical protein